MGDLSSDSNRLASGCFFIDVNKIHCVLNGDWMEFA